MEEKLQEGKNTVASASDLKGIKSRIAAGRTLIMSEVHYRRIIWTLAITCMAVGYFSMWGASVLIQSYGMGSEYSTPEWLAWLAFLGLPLAGRVVLQQSLKGR